MNFLIVKPEELKLAVETDGIAVETWHSDGWIRCGLVRIDDMESCSKGKNRLQVWATYNLWALHVQCAFAGNPYEAVMDFTWTFQGEKPCRETLEVFYHIPNRPSDAFLLIPGVAFDDNKRSRANVPGGMLTGVKSQAVRADMTTLPMILLDDGNIIQSVTIMDESPRGHRRFTTGLLENDVWSSELIAREDEYRVKYRFPPKESGYTALEEWTKPIRHAGLAEKGTTIKQRFFFVAALRSRDVNFHTIHRYYLKRAMEQGEPFAMGGLQTRVVARMTAVRERYFTGAYYAEDVDSPLLQDDRASVAHPHAAPQAMLLDAVYGGQAGRRNAEQCLHLLLTRAQTDAGWFRAVVDPDDGDPEADRPSGIRLRTQCDCLNALLDMRSRLDDAMVARVDAAVRRGLDFWLNVAGSGAFPRQLDHQEVSDGATAHNCFMAQTLVKASMCFADQGLLNRAESLWRDIIRPGVIHARAYYGTDPLVDAEDKWSTLAVAEAGLLLYEASGDKTYLQDAGCALAAWATWVRLLKSTSLSDAGLRHNLLATSWHSAALPVADGIVSWAPIAYGLYQGDALLTRLGVQCLCVAMAYFQGTNHLSIGRVSPGNFQDPCYSPCAGDWRMPHARKGIPPQDKAQGGGCLWDQVAAPLAFWHAWRRFGDVVVNMDRVAVAALDKVDVRVEYGEREHNLHLTPQAGAFPEAFELQFLSAARTPRILTQEGAAVEPVAHAAYRYRIVPAASDIAAVTLRYC